MNIIQELEKFNLNDKCMEAKKQQTDYKIKYIREYILTWVLVNVKRPEVEKINFIDCMCNAGVYKDGDLCTSMEVLKIFINFSQDYPNKKFNLFLNDKDRKRIDNIKKVVDVLMPSKIDNLKIYVDQRDVNNYLVQLSQQDKLFKYKCATVLYVDPYDFGTVNINSVKNFIENYYCELIYNFFISDYVRNGIDERIKKCINYQDIDNKEDLIIYITNELKSGRMKYLFAYKFKSKTNTELYQIIFVTPHIRGLEKLKDALWTVFNGKFYHRNTDNSVQQVSLFDDNDEKEWLLEMHSKEAMSLLLEKFSSKCLGYEEIEVFLIENTMLSTSHIINYVIKPLIKRGKMQKKNIVENKSNYKKDIYEIIGEVK